jgi:hypothetical protein
MTPEEARELVLAMIGKTVLRQLMKAAP